MIVGWILVRLGKNTWDNRLFEKKYRLNLVYHYVTSSVIEVKCFVWKVLSLSLFWSLLLRSIIYLPKPNVSQV